MIHRPIFIVAPPASGASLLFRLLLKSPGVVGPSGAESALGLEKVSALAPGERGWEGERLGREDATDEVKDHVREAIAAIDEPGGGEGEGDATRRFRLLDAAPQNPLRVPFLDALFPESTFVYLHRDPRKALPGMIDGWQSGRFVTHPELPDWSGLPWSFPLVPGWRELEGKDLAELAAAQWMATVRTALDDLEKLQAGRWGAIDYSATSARPELEMPRLCAFLGIPWTGELPPSLPELRQSLKPPKRRSLREHARALDRVLPSTTDVSARAQDALPPPPGTQRPPAENPLRSVFTASFPEILHQLGSALLVSTYQTGKVICARTAGEGQGLNTHFRNFNRPMGMAVADGRIAIGTRSEIWDYRNVPDMAPKIEPAGQCDACFVPRNLHQTGDVAIHEVEFAEGELWFVATNFSCLATLDADHSFIPRWRPPFISALAAEDRCHLNGMCVIEDRVRYVTALGETDSAGGWRENKASGGILLDVESGETVLSGLSMPHSPHWYDDRLWLLESGKGSLAVADLEAGTWETVAEMPGFTRGLAFAGPLAFVGLSQIRETATFGGLPIEKLEERLCGVWIVNIESGEIVGFVRFEDVVQEIFDVAVLPGMRFPEIAEFGSDAAAYAFVLPEEALAEVAQAEPAAKG